MNQSMSNQGTPSIQESVPPVQSEIPPISPTKRSVAYPWLIAIGVVGVGLLSLIVVSKLLSTPNTPMVQVIETPTPTPTPIRTLSTIAAQSAFVALDQSQASLSANLTDTNLDDPSLSPPVLDLPLGLKQ